MTTRLPRTVRMIAQHGPDAFLKRTSDTGKYTGAIVSRRAAAVLRKRSIIEGTYGDFNPEIGGWKPEWDKLRTIVSLRPFKGHKRERTREQRVDKINKAMQGMEAREEKYRQEIQQKKPVKNFKYMFKRWENTAKEKFDKEMARTFREKDE